MLLRDLKKAANESLFNPNKPSKDERILMDIGNPAYWTIKAVELIKQSEHVVEGSVAYNTCIKQAIKLLILTRAHIDDQVKRAAVKKQKKTRKPTSGQNSKTVETP